MPVKRRKKVWGTAPKIKGNLGNYKHKASFSVQGNNRFLTLDDLSGLIRTYTVIQHIL